MPNTTIDAVVMDLLADYQQPKTGEPDTTTPVTESDSATDVFDHVNNKEEQNADSNNTTDKEGDGQVSETTTDPDANELGSIVNKTDTGTTEEGDDNDTEDQTDLDTDTTAPGLKDDASAEGDGDETTGDGGEPSGGETESDDSAGETDRQDGAGDEFDPSDNDDIGPGDEPETTDAGDESDNDEETSDEDNSESSETSNDEENTGGQEDPSSEETDEDFSTQDGETSEQEDLGELEPLGTAEASDEVSTQASEPTTDETDEGDESFDEQGVLNQAEDSLHSSKKVSEHGDQVNSASIVVSEAREISERLGELAKAVVDRHPTASTESYRRLVSLAFESIEDHARFVIGGDTDPRKEDPEITATRNAIKTALAGLNQTTDHLKETLGKFKEVLAILTPQMEKMDQQRRLTLTSDQINELAKNATLDLSSLSDAKAYLAIIDDLKKWLGLALPKYFKQASIGEKPELLPISTLQVQNEDPVLKERIEADLGGKVIATTDLLAGDRVFVFHKQLPHERPQLRFVPVRKVQANPSEMAVDLDINTVGVLLAQIRESVVGLDQLLLILGSSVRSTQILEDWLEEASETDLVLVDLGFLLPYYTKPIFDLVMGLESYAWALVSVLRDYNK